MLSVNWSSSPRAPITGEWKSDTRENKGTDAGKIYLSFETRTEKGDRNQNGSSYAYNELQGLTREQAQNGRASFRLVREAGIIECEGTFTDGKGSGTFRFTPDSGYVAAMKSRGFDFAASKHGNSSRDPPALRCPYQRDHRPRR